MPAGSRPLRDFTVKEEVIDDAVAAVKKLRETPGIRADRVFVLGHSLGGMLAPRIAAADPSIAGLILLAAAIKPLEQAIVDQTRYLALLDGKISPEEQAALDAATKLATDVRALKPGDPPIVTTVVQRAGVLLARPARLRSAGRGEPCSSNRCSCCKASATTRSRWRILRRGSARSDRAPTCS